MVPDSNNAVVRVVRQQEGHPGLVGDFRQAATPVVRYRERVPVPVVHAGQFARGGERPLGPVLPGHRVRQVAVLDELRVAHSSWRDESTAAPLLEEMGRAVAVVEVHIAPTGEREYC